MRVMRIRHVRMCMPHRLVPMPVAVLARRRRVMDVVVMPVVVAVGMLMLQRLVRMLVAV